MERIGHQVKAELATVRERVEERDVLDDAIDRILATATPVVALAALPAAGVRPTMTARALRWLIRRVERALGHPFCAECGCTDRAACEGGCMWAVTPWLSDEKYVCTRCAGW
jgi:hypothetical protein